jgi:hypothetical protein
VAAAAYLSGRVASRVALQPAAGQAVFSLSRDVAGSLQLDFGGPDHLAPLLGVVGNEFAELGGRTAKHRAAQVGNFGAPRPVQKVASKPGTKSLTVGICGSRFDAHLIPIR